LNRAVQHSIRIFRNIKNLNTTLARISKHDKVTLMVEPQWRAGKWRVAAPKPPTFLNSGK